MLLTVCSKLFSKCAPVGQLFSNFHAVVREDFLTLSILKSRIESFKGTDILVDFRSAIEAIALLHYSESLTATKIKHIIKELNKNGKIVEL